jgi:hypothetical protein
MRRSIKRGMSASAVALLCTGVVVYLYLFPSWTEHFSVNGGILQVIDESGQPVPGAMVMRVAVIGAVSGGWDIHSVMIPRAGDTPWVKTQHARWYLEACLTDTNGKAARHRSRHVAVAAAAFSGALRTTRF